MVGTKAKRKKSRAAIPDLRLFQALRERGNYKKLAVLLPSRLDTKDSFDQETVLLRTIAAEVAAHSTDFDQMERLLAPYLKNIDQVPLTAAAPVILMEALLPGRQKKKGDALQQIARARKIAVAVGDQDLVAEALQWEAEIAASRGLFQHAIKNFEDVILHYTITRRSYRLGLCYLGRGRVHIRLGEVEQAERTLQAAIRLLSGSADKLDLARARMSLAEVATATGRDEFALEQLQTAGRAFEELQKVNAKLLAEAAIVEALLRLKRINEAAERLKQAASIVLNPSSEGLTRFCQAEARVYAALVQWKEAEDSARQAVRISKQSRDALDRAQARRTLGEIYLALWRDADAAREFRAAAIYIKRARHRILELEIKLLLSQAIYLIDKAESARLMSEVEEAIAGRDLPRLQEACSQARKRNSAQAVEHFYILTSETLPTLVQSKRHLLDWMVLRALQLSGGNVRNAARTLKKSRNYLHTLIKQLRRGLSVFKTADRRSNQ